MKYCPEEDTTSWKLQYREERLNKHKGCPHLYKGDWEEEKNEEGEDLAVMCHSGETYSSAQANREDDDYYQQLN